MLPPLFWPNEANRKDALLLGAPGVEPEGGPDGTDSRRVCRCRFVADACLVRGLCVGLPRHRTRLQRIRPRLRHHRRQAFRVAAMRAPNPSFDQSDRSVVGSIVLRTSVILVAGKPLISACLRMMSSSLAR